MRPVPRFIIAGLGVAGLALAGCEKQTESPTSGTLAFLCAESVAPVLRREAAAFTRLYTKATISLDSTTTCEALAKLAGKETSLVIISRALNAEERRSFAIAQVSIDTFALARDGIAVIVHPESALRRLTLEQLRGIYSGKIGRWEEVGGSGGKILPLSLSRNTGTAECFFHAIGVDSTFASTLQVLPASRDMIDMVARSRSAIGFVGMNWLGDRVRALALARGASDEFVDIHQASVYRGTYPLVRTIYAVPTGGSYGLANGFIGYLMSAPGQRVFLDSGLVPVTMPVKLIRLDQRT